jgi:hypothetical protein
MKQSQAAFECNRDFCDFDPSRMGSQKLREADLGGLD